MQINHLTLAAALLTLTTSSVLALTVPVAEDTSSTAVGKLTPATGKSMSMAVNVKQTAFIRFNLSDPAVVPSAIVPGNIVSATLRIFVESAKYPGDLTVHAVTSAWTESPATPTAAEPTVDATVLATIPAAELKKEQFISVDVTAAVQAALDVNDFGFAIQTTSAAKVLLGTKEGPGLGCAAVLEIEANLAGATTSDISATSITATGAVNAASAAISGALSAGSFTLTGDLGGVNATLSGALNAASLSLAGDASSVNATLTGNLTLPVTTATTGIIYAGSAPLLHDFGTNNFFAGPGAGNLTMIGYNNAASGTGVLAANTTGTANTASGTFALNQNLTGNANVAIGFEAMRYSLDGYGNTAVGYDTIGSSHPGQFNTAIGFNVLGYNSTDDNTGVGALALNLNKTGQENTAVGFEALEQNEDSDYNTAVGSQALFTNGTNFNSAANDNTAVGYQALYANTTGSQNDASGRSALYANVSGYSNTATGCTAMYSNVNGYENTAIGHFALYHNTSGYGNTGAGESALLSNTGGAYNTALGFGALDGMDGTSQSGNYNIAIGYNAGSNINTFDGTAGKGNFNIDIGAVGVAGESGIIRIGTTGNQTDTFLTGSVHVPVDIYVDGYIYNRWAGNYLRLGDGTVNAGVVWRSSDARLKKDVATIPDALCTLGRLRGVTYHWNEAGLEHLTRDIERQWRSDSGTAEDNRKLWEEKRREAVEKLEQEQTGFIAQELEQVFPAWVRTDEQGYKQINVEQLTGVVVQGVNELSTRTAEQAAIIAAQEKQIAEQQKQIAILTSRLGEIERLLQKVSPQRSALNGVSVK